jgi:hypothetical protein
LSPHLREKLVEEPLQAEDVLSNMDLKSLFCAMRSEDIKERHHLRSTIFYPSQPNRVEAMEMLCTKIVPFLSRTAKATLVMAMCPKRLRRLTPEEQGWLATVVLSVSGEDLTSLKNFVDFFGASQVRLPY